MEKKPYEKPAIFSEKMEFGRQPIFCIKEKHRRRGRGRALGRRRRRVRVPPFCWPPFCRIRLWS